jgi:Ca2+-binding EF-hand superfamily protein
MVSVDFPIPERIIMKRSIISILVAGLCAGAATAVLAAEEAVKTNPKPAESSQSRAADPNDQQIMHEKGAADFKRADKDNDGTLDRKEARKMPRVAKNFDAIDTDHDGTVSLMEVHTYMKDHSAGGKK